MATGAVVLLAGVALACLLVGSIVVAVVIAVASGRKSRSQDL